MSGVVSTAVGEYEIPGGCWDDGPRDVFVLGAGFSIAVSGVFPGTDELGKRAIERLRVQARLSEDDYRVPSDGFRGGQFETWLARLAEDQPYLSMSENLHNRKLFIEVSEALRDVLVECEERVDHVKTSWLFDLVSVWHARRAQVITLNYDTLVERNVANHLLADRTGRQQVTPRHILDDLPPDPTDGGVLTGTGLGTFRLLKLHGSTSWYWVPNDRTGSTIGRWSPPYGESSFGDTAKAERGRLLPGRVPFIVPPTSTKAGFYDNPLTSEIWTRAYEAIRQADRLYFVGYSFPLTDVSVCGMIADSLKGRDDLPELHLVDLAPELVRDRLRAIGIGSVRGDLGEDSRDVSDFVAKYVADASNHVLEHMRSWSLGPIPMVVRVIWGTEHGQYAMGSVHKIDVERDSRTIVVQADGPTNPRPSPQRMNLDHLTGLLDSGDRMVLDVEGRSFVIVDCRVTPQRGGADGIPNLWLIDLMPAGKPPSGWKQESLMDILGDMG